MNMFHINYNCDYYVPLVSYVKEKTPYIIFLFIFIIGFTLEACLVFSIEIGIIKLYNYLYTRKKREEHEKLILEVEKIIDIDNKVDFV